MPLRHSLALAAAQAGPHSAIIGAIIAAWPSSGESITLSGLRSGTGLMKSALLRGLHELERARVIERVGQFSWTSLPEGPAEPVNDSATTD